MKKYKDYLVSYLKDYNKNFNGYILGLSGGLDSAVAALLAQEAVSDVLVVIINIASTEKDLKDARNFVKDFKLRFLEINLTDEYNALVQNLESHMPLNELAKINLKARLRMVTLYSLGQTENKLILGTDNLAEIYTGYFTKYGDGAADLYVLSELTKTEVYELASLLSVPAYITSKVPSAGLYDTQTDEDEIGVTYALLDAFLRGEKIEATAEKRILHLHNISVHKREKITRPKRYKEGRDGT
ncbi:MAG TPA: NAD(+) synthase [Bacilli bacterium]|nr:NAD(+) synthase [Bacilli bacterium]